MQLSVPPHRLSTRTAPCNARARAHTQRTGRHGHGLLDACKHTQAPRLSSCAQAIMHARPSASTLAPLRARCLAAAAAALCCLAAQPLRASADNTPRPPCPTVDIVFVLDGPRPRRVNIGVNVTGVAGGDFARMKGVVTGAVQALEGPIARGSHRVALVQLGAGVDLA